MKYLWEDYAVFDLNIPKWICAVIGDHHDDKFQKLFSGKFLHQNKKHLLPKCALP